MYVMSGADYCNHQFVGYTHTRVRLCAACMFNEPNLTLPTYFRITTRTICLFLRCTPSNAFDYQSVDPYHQKTHCIVIILSLCLSSSPTVSFPFILRIPSPHIVSQPPLLISISNFLLMTLGIPWLSHTVLRRASYLF